MSTALIFGANGVSGLALIEALSQTSTAEWKKIIAVSRRPAVLDHQDSRVEFVSADLLGSKDELVSKLKKAGAAEVTHVAFYAYVAKDDEEELIEVNRKLFSNSLNAIAAASPHVKAVLLQTGYKYYGVHKGGDYLASTPFKEDAPRHKGDNFYYVQEDMLREAAKKHGWAPIITRPNFIQGASLGNFMSLATTVALYAAGRKAADESLVFPGSSASYNLAYDFSYAGNNARFQIFALTNEKAYGRVFNIHDGKPVRWSELWPKIANYFDVSLPSPPADSAPSNKKIGSDIVLLHPSESWAASHASTFSALTEKHDLNPDAFSKFATWSFLDFATGRTWADVASMDAAREIGWTEEVDTFESFVKVFEQLKKLKIIPA